MGENEIGGAQTAMERLCRELMDAVVSCAPTVWCGEHGIGIHGTRLEQDRENARADISRRIDGARDEDDGSDGYAAVALKALTGMHRGHAMCTRGEAARVEHVELSSGSCALRGHGVLVVGDYGSPFKRPVPKAIGADGAEVKAGETVWLAPEYRKMAATAKFASFSLYGIGDLDALTVRSIGRVGYVDDVATLAESDAWCPASWLTHEHPDTRSLVIDGMDEETVERIDRLVKDGRWLDD